MSKFERCKHQIEKIKGNHHAYPFPKFLEEIRRAHCISVKVVADDLEIPYQSLYYLEWGPLKKLPEPQILSKLAQYYDVPVLVLMKKALDYVAGNKGIGESP